MKPTNREIALNLRFLPEQIELGFVRPQLVRLKPLPGRFIGVTLERLVDPTSLLSASRLDVLGKIPLALAIKDGKENAWSRELFFQCLLSMRPDGRFSEDGLKNSLHDYEHHFRKLAISLSKNGFDGAISKIQISSNGTVNNGAHRVAAAIALGLNVDTVQTRELAQKYDWDFFVGSGMPRVYLDHLALLYARYVDRSRAIVLSNMERSDIDRVRGRLLEMAPIVFEKTAMLTEIGIRRNTELLYGHLDWFTPQLLEKLVRERFDNEKGGNCSVLIYELPHGETPRSIKESLRATLDKKYFERQIHGTDDWLETLTLGEVWTNSNSIRYLNESPIGSEYRLMKHLSSSLRHRTPKERDNFVVDSGASLEAHGIRLTTDVDHICDTDRHKRDLLLIGDCHRETYLNLGLSPAEVVNDPRNHLLFGGYKFTTLEVEFRRLRNDCSPKAVGDLRLLLDSPRIRVEAPLYQDPERSARARAWRRRSFWQVRLDGFLSTLPPIVRRQVAILASKLRSLRML